MDEAATGTTAETKAQRRRALTEFELRRDPDASDQLIGSRAHCSSKAVQPIRAELLEQGTLPSSAQPPTHPKRRRRDDSRVAGRRPRA
jgi:hypothetical protein